MLIRYYANKKIPTVVVVATKLYFLQYSYRFKINNKTLYSQTSQVTYRLQKAGYWAKMITVTPYAIYSLRHMRHMEQGLQIYLQCFSHSIEYISVSEAFTQIAKFMGPTWSPSGSYRPWPQMGPMLAS